MIVRPTATDDTTIWNSSLLRQSLKVHVQVGCSINEQMQSLPLESLRHEFLFYTAETYSYTSIAHLSCAGPYAGRRCRPNRT
jgi:hypothetical protein